MCVVPKGDTLNIKLSELDALRFGVVTAHATLKDADDVARCDAYCRDRGVQLLIARCSTSAIEAARALERTGGWLMDCIVCYRRDLRRHPYEEDARELDWIREAEPQDADAIATVARRAFERYDGHYHSDPHLQHDAAVEAYRDWAVRICNGQEEAHVVLCATKDGAIVGFCVARRNSSDEAEAFLSAVAPEFQGSGIPFALGYKLTQWASAQGVRWGVLCVPIRHVPLQRAMIRHKSEIFSSHYVFHKWYDR